MQVNGAHRRAFLTVQKSYLGSFKGLHMTAADKYKGIPLARRSVISRKKKLYTLPTKARSQSG